MSTNIQSDSGKKSPKAEMTPSQEPPLAKKAKTTSMDSSFPVLLPEDPCLRMSDTEFEAYIFNNLPALTGVENAVGGMHIEKPDDSSSANAETTQPKTTNNAFVDALDRAASDPSGEKAHEAEMAMRNRRLTTNAGMAFASTQSPLLELFNQGGGEEDQDCNDNSLTTSLEQAWEVDPLMTLKIIWVTRSIHLGKGEKWMFYRQLGWLGQNHPRTLLRNLKWLYRPVIKTDAKEREGDKQVMVEKVSKVEDGDTVEVDDYDVIRGGSHGYWKDLLNILVLSAEEKFDMSDPEEVLLAYHRIPKKGRLTGRTLRRRPGGGRGGRGKGERVQEKRPKSQAEQKEASKAEEARRYEQVLNRLATNSFHRALHLAVARLFADQLRKDMLLLEAGNKNNNETALRDISLCAKWAPSLERFHDKHTLIASTIAELLFPDSGLDSNHREAYLKRAREQYRAHTLSPLRKALSIVERDISAETFSNIQYSQVPSVAMNQYKDIFYEKDRQHYTDYLEKVAKGEDTISGAVLTPGLLVKNVMSAPNSLREIMADMQWKTLVQRIKDSGALSSAIAVCDVSGSMEEPLNRQKIAPIHNAIGLSLVMAEVTKPPFGGRIITFSQDPSIHIVGDSSLTNRVADLQSSDWGYNTDFVKVFRQLILPLAVENKVPPEDMVKRVFVFSDMQFDEAQPKLSHFNPQEPAKAPKWETHQQIVAKEFRDHGYEVPDLVYWNLAERSGAVPVTADMEGTALVSGQSQALMKVFLEGGVFGEEEEEEEAEDGQGEGEDRKMEVVDGDGEWGVVQEQGNKKKKKVDPMGILRKIVGHEAFDMLRVVD
ncbi:hypothetical protein ACJ72_01091 [Emergomyces africanus]|uniref:Uncharacterized protein n=1 Tax=Emergomyces africanus TaxID=1955775 RepID=A0A1B7P679_9EURO|nr:hypothetical protein ACJ72_01091 [Emergomyces africanus]